ncbi:Plasmodium exported protein (hyp10), unknown, putative [Plasmodium sp. gorilla clade G1]|nr:Plasmodium exported protein (hyp10), unknown, putative [Plasmodium sp. gorilla clade G1]
MSCKYFKLFLFFNLLCILIITHKLYLEQITHNKKNRGDVINAGYKRLLCETHQTDIFKTYLRENSVTHPIENKLEVVTEYNKTTSKSTLNDEIQQKHHSQPEKLEWKNEINNKILSHKSHEISHYKNMTIFCIIVSSMMGLPILPMLYMLYYKRKINKNIKNISIMIKHLH